MEDHNRSAKRRADEAAMDKKAKMKNTRPKARPVDVSPTAEADDQEHVKGYKAGGRIQMSGKNFRGTF